MLAKCSTKKANQNSDVTTKCLLAPPGISPSSLVIFDKRMVGALRRFALEKPVIFWSCAIGAVGTVFYFH